MKLALEEFFPEYGHFKQKSFAEQLLRACNAMLAPFTFLNLVRSFLSAHTESFPIAIRLTFFSVAAIMGIIFAVLILIKFSPHLHFGLLPVFVLGFVFSSNRNTWAALVAIPLFSSAYLIVVRLILFLAKRLFGYDNSTSEKSSSCKASLSSARDKKNG